MPPEAKWVYYSLRFATFALAYDQNATCIAAPPIAHWCVGRSLADLNRYWSRRGARIIGLG